eukprot:12861796-Heterocapsa_arctica.AAC.1
MELEAMLARPRAERTPVPVSADGSGGTSFATPREVAAPQVAAPPGLSWPIRQTPKIHTLILDQKD